ncbi:MAG TPA: hypothetical protein PLY93_04020 [Turneriella sp.]|nr:hypothetical protein [Turneriella sp.]
MGFLSLLTPCLEAKTITVCSTCQYISPKTAIDGAQHGDTIIFDGGIYNVGTLTVSKRLSLVGKKNPIFDGENKGHILDLRADNITIEGITLKNTGVSDLKEFAAIHAESLNHC